MHGHACKLYIFQSHKASTFEAMHFDEDPFTCQCKNENKKAQEFQISHFYWLFSSDIMAVKGLNSGEWFYKQTGTETPFSCDSFVVVAVVEKLLETVSVSVSLWWEGDG